MFIFVYGQVETPFRKHDGRVLYATRTVDCCIHPLYVQTSPVSQRREVLSVRVLEVPCHLLPVMYCVQVTLADKIYLFIYFQASASLLALRQSTLRPPTKFPPTTPSRSILPVQDISCRPGPQFTTKRPDAHLPLIEFDVLLSYTGCIEGIKYIRVRGSIGNRDMAGKRYGQRREHWSRRGRYSSPHVSEPGWNMCSIMEGGKRQFECTDEPNDVSPNGTPTHWAPSNTHYKYSAISQNRILSITPIFRNRGALATWHPQTIA